MTELVRVGDVLSLQRREVQVDPAADYMEIGVRSFGKGIFHKEPISGSGLGRKRIFHIRSGDLVISNVFAWEGAIAVASDAEEGKVGSHRFMTFTASDDRLDPRWAAWFFLSEPGLELIRRASPGSAGRNRTLAVGRFEELQVPLPSKEEQLEVAGWLDALREASWRALALADRSAATLMALSGALTGNSGLPTQLRDLVTPVRRPLALNPAQSYRLLGCRWYGGGLFTREIKTGAEVSAKQLYEVRQGDLVYNRLFAWKGSFALAGEEHVGALVSGEFPTFRVNTDLVEPGFLLAAMGSPGFLDQVDRKSAGGTPTSRNRLKEANFLDIEVPLPDMSHQRAIAMQADEINRALGLRRRAIETAQALVSSGLNEQFG